MAKIQALGVVFMLISTPAFSSEIPHLRFRNVMWSIIATMQKVNPEIASCIGRYSYQARTTNKYKEIKDRFKTETEHTWPYDVVVKLLEEKCGSFGGDDRGKALKVQDQE